MLNKSESLLGLAFDIRLDVIRAMDYSRLKVALTVTIISLSILEVS
jgi:hypothetical protein